MFERFINKYFNIDINLLYEKSQKISTKIKYTDNIHNFYFSLINEWYGFNILDDSENVFKDFFKHIIKNYFLVA